MRARSVPATVPVATGLPNDPRLFSVASPLPPRFSGTLSPLDSFAGELGIDFPHRLEAPHVINVRKQCLVTSIGYFGGVSLDAR